MARRSLALLAPVAMVGACMFASVSGGSNAIRQASATAGASSVPTVSCFEAIGHQKSGRGGGNRVVLDVVSDPAAYADMSQVIATGTHPWRYWHKAGLVIQMGRPAVTVSVPKAWRTRVAITWGNSGIVGALRIGHCPPPATAWTAYAGGFYLRSPGCVPLVFQVGQKAAKVWFGVGRRCPA